MKYNWMQNSYLTCLGSTDRMFSREFHCIYRTQPVLFHRCILNRLGSQLARSSPIRSMVSTGCQSAHQLAGTRSHPSSSSPVGTALDQSDSSHYCDNSTAVAHILLDQFGILLIPSHLPGARNLTTVALSRLNSPSPTEWASSSGNLTQVVLCLRDPPSEHVRHARHRTGWLQFTFHPTRTTELGWSTPSPYLGTA